MRADCMLFALGLMRQWRSITTVADLASLVLLASVYGGGGLGGVKLMTPKSLFRNNFKVKFSMNYKQDIWAVYPS